MKVTKTTIYRLSVEKSCGCKAAREYEDARYTKPVPVDPGSVFEPCVKHGKGAIAEFAGEMLVEALDKEAETAGKATYAPLQRPVEPGDSAGVTAVAESAQAMGVTNLPSNRPKRDPTTITHVSVDRPSATRKAAAGAIAPSVPADEAGIEISTEIGVEAPEDPNLSVYMEDALGGLGGVLDTDDARLQGVPQKYLQEGE